MQFQFPEHSKESQHSKEHSKESQHSKEQEKTHFWAQGSDKYKLDIIHQWWNLKERKLQNQNEGTVKKNDQ